MAAIVMADDGVAFDGRSPERGPLGGAEGAFVALAEALAARGNQVRAFTNCPAPLSYKGVDWTPIAQGLPETADLYIANRGDRLIGLVPRAKSRVFWIHNPGGYLKKARYVLALLRWRPAIVAIGTAAGRTVPAWLPRRKLAVIPYGLAPEFRAAPAREPPGPVAVFTSNPQRGLDWLMDLWTARIRPKVPSAELRIYAGPAVYGAAGTRQAPAMQRILDRAASLLGQGVRRFSPLPRAELVAALKQCRVMLYRGDANETFCAAVAEAQALGVPAVGMPLGSLPERIVDGQTGFLAQDDAAFADRAVALLTDDALWRRMHLAALEAGRGQSWDAAATRFEELMR